MADYLQRHSTDWVEYFTSQGHSAVRPLAAGVEGAVYRLGNGIVAKVWSGRPPADLGLIRQVYADIAHHPLPFATPQILATEDRDGTLVTYERELPGSPLRVDAGDSQPAPAPVLTAQEKDVLLTVLRGLASVPGSAAMRRLTVQGDDRPLWEGHSRFPDALAALVQRAARRHGDVLGAAVPALATVIEQTTRALRDLPSAPLTVVHGDLVAPNIHVDDAGHPVAVLDFGFFTTAGDPAFEAAVAAAVWDMYGPDAARHTEELTRTLAMELNHDEKTLTLYQTAYALTTYDLFSQDGSDGHFHWCAALLNRHAHTSPGRLL
ncbi:aminoglycoside phosphotransferase family protein [Streptomyces sp. NPDC046805]|uniref:phosphotransferase family protein n=1 Tax=Streptomyces sp. NPDC046805 TaxID=3155134 RepID=UPI00340D5497